MSGQRRGPGAMALRAAMSVAEPFYRGVIAWRNRRFDRGIGVKRLPRPVISVGNITAGGTGKTPVVRWVCEKLMAMGAHPAVLLRGYKSVEGLSDEQQLLQEQLGGSVIVKANPNRFEGGQSVLAGHSEIDVFVLDDGFQHRRLARDFDLVLIDATRPFGFNHVHPRGLLREPLDNLRRASAVLITRSDECGLEELDHTADTIKRHFTGPLFYSRHVHRAYRFADESTAELRNKKIFAFCGIGNPNSFVRQLGGNVAGSRFLGDHHAYLQKDISQIETAAAAAGAQVLVTTEKDWTKLSGMKFSLPVARAELAIEFLDDDEGKLAALLPHQR